MEWLLEVLIGLAEWLAFWNWNRSDGSEARGPRRK
jgi:hypothetical protein